MATSSQREGGRQSAPLTPSKSPTEKKPQTTDNDIHKLIAHQEQRPTQVQEGSSTLKQEDPQPPHVKEEEEELWITKDGEHLLDLEEADLTKLPLTVVSVKTEDDEHKPPESLGCFCPADVQQLIGHQECPNQLQGSSTLKQEDPQPPHVKEEQEDPQLCYIKEEEVELWTTQEGECLLGQEEADLIKLPLTVKTEEKPPGSLQLHHSPSEENRAAGPPSSRSPQHMTTEAYGDHCGGLQADKLLVSDRDDTTHSPDDENWDDTQEHLSSDTDSEGDMRTHTGNKHRKCSKKKTGKNRLTCSVCAKTFSFKCRLTQHMLTHTGEKPLSCSVCAKSFCFKSHLTRHMLTHTGGKPFSCSVCAKSFSLKSYMTRHMLTHTGENLLSCSVCAKRFIFKRDLTRHMLTHTGEKAFNCSVCAKSFSLKTCLTQHMLTHTGEKPFSCSVCGQGFARKEHMVSHMRTHTGEKPFCCSVCGRRFAQKEQMVSHMRTHTGEKPFSCSVCGRRFSQKQQMVSHIRTHTGEKPFCCSVCGKLFSQKTSLVSHMRTHTGEKHFSCSVCGESYSAKCSLTTHMLKHNGGKPFSCSVCGKRFFQKEVMKRHMRTHTGETPISC
ncbi:gastrula zinc finger protein XlCGF57.1-like [Dunckerocampus dactyliophorus]|uniref:gastrula zinc finger protein XlCGF57.1-like n=1 Tax=Dunckerocampus dactyliophorus TaxID=161453 RepID=UPI0024050C57|nr:gastrula zinc finger protein XlCGF57.1-like [Dunckerocampus dactyliophorus]